MIYSGGRKNGYLESAIVGKAHGLKGHVTLKTLGAAPERFLTLSALYALKEGKFLPMEIQDVKIGNQSVMVKFKGVNDRTAAEKLNGLQLYSAPEDVPELEEGEYLIADLIGCAVMTQNEKQVGILQEVQCHGAADVYVLQGERGNVLFPALKKLFLNVDVANKRIVVDENVLNEVVLYED